VRQEVYLSADIEADGPIPGPYSMLSVGLAVAGRRTGDEPLVPADPEAETFYRELKPISADFVPAALAVSGLDRERLVDEGEDPASAMADLTDWIAGRGGRPILVAYPLAFDWMFLYWYLMRFTGASPFGHSGHLDMKTMYAVKADVPVGRSVKRLMPKSLLSTRRHTHHALDDAIEQAELFVNLSRWNGSA
jgi:DNA polymerase III epsilon subunit-like protein